MALDMPSYLMGAIKGASSAGVKYVVVQELPTTGEEGTIYLVPKSTSKTNNVYNEYMYINNNWELIGDTQADISGKEDTSNKVTSISNQSTNTQYPSAKCVYDNLSGKQDVIQYSTIPTASSSTVGKIVQYTGTTTNDYTNGYFYIGIEDDGVYSWENINVQSSSGGSTDYEFIFANVNNPSSDERTKLLELYNKTIDELRKIIIINTDNSSVYKIYSYDNKGSDYIEFKPNSSISKELGYYGTFDVIIDEWNILQIYQSSINTTRASSSIIPVLATNRNYATAYTPLYDGSPATKKYVDDKSTQVSTMPTASSTTVGKIVQYIGTTDSTYTNGYFYIGTTDGASTPTYSWTQLNVQPSSGGGGDNVKLYWLNLNNVPESQTITDQATLDILDDIITDYENNKIVFLENRISLNHSTQNFYIVDSKYTYNNETYYLFNEISRSLVIDDQVWGYTELSLKQSQLSYNSTTKKMSKTGGYTSERRKFIDTNVTYQTTFMPSKDCSPATKKYVDDSISTAIGTALSSSY